MGFLFDKETREKLRGAGVDAPRESVPSLSEGEMDELVSNHPEMLDGPPAQTNFVTEAFGHWAEEAEAARAPSNGSGDGANPGGCREFGRPSMDATVGPPTPTEPRARRPVKLHSPPIA